MKTDYLIIGGGIYGCYVAWRLAQQGADVCLIEKHDVASGASGGFGKRGVRANGRDLRELPLMRLAYGIWPNLQSQLGAEIGFEQIGHLLLIETERDLSSAASIAWVQNQQGISTEVLNQEQVREREPGVSERVIGALYCPNDGVSDHTQTTQAVAAAATKLGVRFLKQTSIASIKCSGKRVASVTTSTEQEIQIEKSLAILCNGGAQDFLDNHFSLHLPVWNRLYQALLTEPLKEQVPAHLIGHASRRLAMKPGLNGGSMISGGWLGVWNASEERGEAQPDQIAANLAEAVAVYPELQNRDVERVSADRLESQSVDEIPIIDQVPDVENVFFATGWSGHGWAIAPVVSNLISDWMFSGSKPSLLAPFSYGRFASK